MRSVEHSEQDTWKGRTVIDEGGKRWPDIDDALNWEPVPGSHAPAVAVGIAHPYEQMVEQIMYGKELDSFQSAVELAIQVLHSGLSDEERKRGLAGMVQAGIDSGIYEGDPFEEAYAELRKLEREESEARTKAA